MSAFDDRAGSLASQGAGVLHRLSRPDNGVDLERVRLFSRRPKRPNSVVGDLTQVSDDETLWCKALARRYEGGALVAVVPLGEDTTALTLRWGYVIKVSDTATGKHKTKMVLVRVTRFTPASHPLGPVGELDPDQ